MNSEKYPLLEDLIGPELQVVEIETTPKQFDISTIFPFNLPTQTKKEKKIDKNQLN